MELIFKLSINGIPSFPMVLPERNIRSLSIKPKDNNIVFIFEPASINKLFIPLIAKSLKIVLNDLQAISNKWVYIPKSIHIKHFYIPKVKVK